MFQRSVEVFPLSTRVSRAHDKHGARLSQVAHDLGTAAGRPAILAIVRAAARELTQADGATCVLTEGEDASVDPAGPMRASAADGDRATLDQLAEWVVQRKTPVVIPDVHHNAQLRRRGLPPTIRSVVMVPVGDGSPVGALGVCWRAPHMPTDADVETLEVMARSAARALTQVELSTLRAALEHERADKRAAQAAAKGKDDFLAIISHELRQPLHASLAALDVMAQRASRNKGERARAVLQRQLGHMLRLIDDLLDASRIVRNEITVRFETIDIRTVIEQARESTQAALDARQHHLVVTVPDAPVWVQADAHRLHQVVANLVGNAAKFSPPGSQITVTLATTGAHVTLRVADTGRGIPADVLPRIFELFTRGAADEPGFGIGLAVADRLVKLHGGTSDVHSGGPDQGSAFSVRLPAVVSA